MLVLVLVSVAVPFAVGVFGIVVIADIVTDIVFLLFVCLDCCRFPSFAIFFWFKLLVSNFPPPPRS